MARSSCGCTPRNDLMGLRRRRSAQVTSAYKRKERKSTTERFRSCRCRQFPRSIGDVIEGEGCHMPLIAIVGPGAVGSLLAVCLREVSRHEIILCARRPVSEL